MVVRRAVTSIVALTALAAAFTAGAVFTGGLPGGLTAADPAVPPPPGQHPPIALVNADLTPAGSCPDLLGWYVGRGLARVTAWGWNNPTIYRAYPEGDLSGAMPGGGVVSSGAGSAVGSAAGAAQPGMVRATASATGTNVQEAGVDEPDIVKTDGTLLVRAQDDVLTTYDVTGSTPERLATLHLPDLGGAEVLLVGDRVVVIGTDTRTMNGQGPDPMTLAPPPATRVLVVDVADPARPAIVDTAVYEAGLVTARQHGDVVRLVLGSGLPPLEFVQPDYRHSEQAALARNREIVRQSTIEDWLPSVTTYDGDRATTRPLLDCAAVALPAHDATLGTTTVVGFDPAQPGTRTTTAVATETSLAYFSADRMYLATSTPDAIWGCCDIQPGLPDGPGAPAVADGTSHLYAFTLDGTATTYAASGEVDGSIADRWSMDEYAGVLRVAVGPTRQTGNFNSIVTLEQDGADLVEVGRVDRLGVDEQIRSMRWFDGLAIMVTFRQVDPLYAIDLTDPAHPRTLGSLKIPGYSDYLHPLGSRRLLGLGQLVTSRVTGTEPAAAQAGLFDVGDLTRPRRIDAVTYRPGTTALAGTDPRQFTWLPAQRTALTVIADGYDGRTGWVSELRLRDGRLTNRLVPVEYGSEVDQVRLVPLPDGRVVLVTGDRVTDFPLGA